MNANLVILMLLVSIGWCGWPIVANFATAVKDPYVRGFLVNAATTLCFIPFVWGKIPASALVSRGGALLLLAGAVNFCGHALFPRIQTMTGSQISVYGTVIGALAITGGVLGGIFFFGDSVSAAKLACIAVIIAGVVGLAFVS